MAPGNYSITLMGTKHVPNMQTNKGIVLIQTYAAVWEGAQIRIIFYDEDLFRRSQQAIDELKEYAPALDGPVAKKEVWRFYHPKGFQKRNIQSQYYATDNIKDGSNGQLLALDLSLEIDSSANAVKHKKLFVRRVGTNYAKECTPGGDFFAIDVFVPMKIDLKVEYRKVGTIKVPKNGRSIADAKILFRVIAVDNLGKFPPNAQGIKEVMEGDVFAATYFLKDTTPAGVPLKLSQGNYYDPSLQIGGTGSGTATAPIDSTSRVIEPDLTGFYELFIDKKPSDLKDPDLLMSVNQVGHAIVGWITRPIYECTPGIQPPYPKPAFLGDNDRLFFRGNWNSTDKNWVFEWEYDPHPINYSSGTISLSDSIDPYQWATCTKIGVLSPPKDPKNDDSMMLAFGDQQTTFMYAYLVNHNVRWSSQVLEKIPDKYKQKVYSDQVLFVSRSVWQRLQNFVRDPNHSQKLQEKITTWSVIRTNPTIDEQQARQAVADAFQSEMQFWVTTPYYDEALVHLHAALKDTQIKNSNGEEEDAMKWCRMMVIKEMEAAWTSATNNNYAASLQHFYDNVISTGFRTARIPYPGMYIYKCEFQYLGAGVKFTVGSIGGYSFLLKITKFEVNKSQMYEGPIDESILKPSDWNITHEYTGWMGEGGIGLTFGIGSKFGGSGGGGTTPNVVYLRSTKSLAPEDFYDAKIFPFVLTSGKINVDPAGSIGASSRTWISVWAKGAYMEADISEWFGGTSLANKIEVGKEPPKLELSVTLIEAGVGLGYVAEHATKKRIRKKPTEDQPTAEEHYTIKWRSGTFVHFSANASEISKDTLANLDNFYAVEKAFFVGPEGMVSMWGHSSPEGTDNMQLSKRRAETVYRATQNAFGKEFPLPAPGTKEYDKILESCSDWDARRDMKMYPNTKVYHKWEFDDATLKRWDIYRKVDIILDGVITVSANNILDNTKK
jgi:outer membrane protein OmpA-like peptidoglycan-associated protein